MRTLETHASHPTVIDALRCAALASLAWLVAVPAIAQTSDPAAGTASTSAASSEQKDDDIATLASWAETQKRLAAPSPLVDPHARAQRIAAAQPARLEPHAWIPPNLEAHVLLRLALLFDALGDVESARPMFERAIALGRGEPESWRGLARALVRSGEIEPARNALLASIDTAGSNAEQLAASHRDLGELALLERRSADAVLALEIAQRHAPHDAHIARLLDRARQERSPGIAAEADRAVALRIATVPTQLHRTTEDLAQSLLARISPEARERLHAIRVRLDEPHSQRAAWAALSALVALFVLGRAARGRGDLAVAIEYPAELRGTFTVRIATRAPKRKGARRTSGVEVLAGGPSSDTVHTLVSRETRFRGLRPGRYFVTVEGLLQAAESEEVLAELFEDRNCIVARGTSARLEFDLRPNECPVDIAVLWDKRPAKDAGVVALGAPGTLRYARGGPVRLGLRRGSHRIAIGSGDRVAVVQVDVESYAPKAIAIDLAGSEDVVFKGCPPAVELYLHGDVAGAARALEREGQAAQSHVLLARMHRDEGRREQAAEHFERAECWLDAAELWAEVGDARRAAPLFDRAGDAQRAGRTYREAGSLAEAGAAFERARDFEAAIDCYRDANAVTQWIDALERAGRVFEASQVALEKTERRRAIRLLQQVLPEDERYAEASLQLADVLEKEGHAELAAQRLEEYVAAAGAEARGDAQFHLAELYEDQGDVERSIGVLEALRLRDPTYPNLATRIETLRKQRSAERQVSSGRASPAQGLQTTAPLLGESRYQLLEEIGRGGMGVVYRAHDKRLNREVALKRMPRSLREHPKAVQYFLREAQAVARLNHRNIVTVYDVDQEENVFFITMELLRGHPLNTVLRKKGRIGARDVAKLGIQVAAGLAYAHDNGVIHRDIKTANLFLTTDKRVSIMDFGLAKMVEEVRKGATIIGGTPFYMAPEQATGGDVDHRADLYALGVTLFELATGKVPFEDGDVTYHHRHTPPPDPRTLEPSVPAALAELILSLLEKSPSARPASAHDVRERLEQIARSEG